LDIPPSNDVCPFISHVKMDIYGASSSLCFLSVFQSHFCPAVASPKPPVSSTSKLFPPRLSPSPSLSTLAAVLHSQNVPRFHHRPLHRRTRHLCRSLADHTLRSHPPPRARASWLDLSSHLCWSPHRRGRHPNHKPQLSYRNHYHWRNPQLHRPVPVLLSVAGIIHECSQHGVPNRQAKPEAIVQLALHPFVVTGVALAAAGGSSLGKPESAKNNYHRDHKLQEIGYILLMLSSLFLAIYAAATYRGIRNGPASYNSRPAPNRESQALRLLYCVLGALPFVIVRAFYGVVFAFDHSPAVNPVSGTFAVKFVLIFLVQTIAALLLVTGGFWTSGIRGDGERGDAETTAQVDLEAEMPRG
jgi:hypothetical protein